jgi:drug/metabolite transporter (DMT)-like permease
MLGIQLRSTSLLGIFAAITSLLLSSSYPAISRATIASHLPPADLLVLRLGVSGLLLLPYLWHVRKRVEARVWKIALVLSFLHGWGMAGFILFGLQFAPASHAAVLGPGTISVWIAVIAWLSIKRRPSNAQLFAMFVIAISAMAIVGIHLSSATSVFPTLYGDVQFLLASACGAGYLFLAGQWKIPALQGVSICAVFSAIVVVPVYLLSGSGTLFSGPMSEVLWHGIYQGVLIGVLSYALVNYSINILGSQRAGILFATTPILASIFGVMLLSEIPNPTTWFWLTTMFIAVILGARK